MYDKSQIGDETLAFDSSAPPEDRSAAIARLVFDRRRDLVERMRVLLVDADPWVRAEAVRALFLLSNDEGVRDALGWVLNRLSEPLSDHHPPDMEEVFRESVLLFLGQSVRRRSLAQFKERTLFVLIHVLVQQESARLLRAAYIALLDAIEERRGGEQVTVDFFTSSINWSRLEQGLSWDSGLLDELRRVRALIDPTEG